MDQNPAHIKYFLRSKETILRPSSDGLDPDAAWLYFQFLFSSVPLPHSDASTSRNYLRQEVISTTPDWELMRGALHILSLILVRTLKVRIFLQFSWWRIYNSESFSKFSWGCSYCVAEPGFIACYIWIQIGFFLPPPNSYPDAFYLMEFQVNLSPAQLESKLHMSIFLFIYSSLYLLILYS